MLPNRLTMCDDVLCSLPQDAAGQFCDKGHSYISVLYYEGADEEALARASKDDAEAELRTAGQLGAMGNVATILSPRARVWPAEEYHQNYYLKKPERYKYYKGRCGRVRRLKDVWGDDAGSHDFSYANTCENNTSANSSSTLHSSLKPGEDGSYSLPTEWIEWIVAASAVAVVILLALIVAVRRYRRRAHERRRERQHHPGATVLDSASPEEGGTAKQLQLRTPAAAPVDVLAVT